MRAASFDLETTNLNGNFGIILCGCIKPFDKSVVTFRADKLNYLVPRVGQFGSDI